MWLTTIRYIQATERDTCVSRQTVHAFSTERERERDIYIYIHSTRTRDTRRAPCSMLHESAARVLLPKRRAQTFERHRYLFNFPTTMTSEQIITRGSSFDFSSGKISTTATPNLSKSQFITDWGQVFEKIFFTKS